MIGQNTQCNTAIFVRHRQNTKFKQQKNGNKFMLTTTFTETNKVNYLLKQKKNLNYIGTNIRNIYECFHQLFNK